MNFDRLRALLFQQAMRGQLVPQFDEEKSVNIMPIVTSDVPHELPRKWVWVRSDEILEFIRGVTFPASAKRSALSEGIVRCLTTGSVQKRHNLAADVFVPSTYVKKDRQYLKKNDVVISSANSKELVGKSIIWKGGEPRVSFGGFLTVARVKKDEINSIFVYYFFQFLFESRYFANLSTQTTNIANLSNALLSSVLFPLPPIEEQERIVAKLEEAFAEIDRAEKAYGELQTLAGVLRGQILQEAIQGKLVPQLAEEGVVEQIGAAPEEVPFEIPEKWKWYYLGSVIEYGKSNQVSGDEITSQTWVLDLEDIEKNTGRILEKKRGVPSTSNKNKFESGYVLYSKLRPYLNKVVVADEAGVCTTEIVPINVNGASVPLDAKYLQTYLMSPFFVNYANQASYGVKMPRLGTKDARAALIPIPPLEEQKRIVQKVVELLSQTDSLAGC